MTKYVNTSNGAIHTVDITIAPDAFQALIELRSEADIEPVKAELIGMGRTIVSQTTVGGKPMLVTIGPRNESELIDEISAKNGRLVPQVDKKPFDAWKVRSLLGFGGQSLQLASSLMKGKPDLPLLTFATSNMAASGINLVYKAQKRDDPYQLRLLKQTINDKLAPNLREGAELIDVNDTRALLRERNKPKAVDPAEEFMRKNSVNVGELGLRYVGAVGLAFPVKNWKATAAEAPHVGAMWKAMIWEKKTEDRLRMIGGTPMRTVAGLGSILGKTIALTSKVPDPYNTDKPHTRLDTFREKHSFVMGGLVEAVAFSVLGVDAFINTGKGKRTGPTIFGKERRDWLSVIGAAMFVSGYIVRSWAHFADREVNMQELYAHASDTIALLPQDKIPQAMADTAAYLADHFKKKPDLNFTVIYNRLSDDLARSHHIVAEPPVATEKAFHSPEVNAAIALTAQPANTVSATGSQHTAPTPVALARTA